MALVYSQHLLATTVKPGFVTVPTAQTASKRLYRADRQRLGPLEAFLESFWAGQLDRLATLAEEVSR